MFGKLQEHLAAGSRASAFHETQVALGNFGLQREIELTQAPPLPPFP
jgi:hypothetical protein